MALFSNLASKGRLRVVLAVFSVPYLFAAVLHLLRAVPFGLAPGHASPARHAVFVFVNLAVAALLVVWPKRAIVPLGLFTLQQLGSHGIPLARGLRGSGPLEGEDAIATAFVLGTFAVAAAATVRGSERPARSARSRSHPPS